MSTTSQTPELKTAIEYVLKNPGLYWLASSTVKGEAVAVVSFRGKIFQMKNDGELTPDGFNNNALFNGPLPFPK
jgi:hypothetical protein